MENQRQGFTQFLKSGQMLPKEEMLEVKKENIILNIGIPKESSYQENRIAIVPDAVGLLVERGHNVVIQSGAGKASFFQDTDYSEAGATIVQDLEEVYKADIIIKVAPPSPEETELIKSKQTIISPIHLSTLTDEYFRKLIAKKVTAIAFEYIKDKVDVFPIVRAMSELAGNTSILIASEYLSNAHEGKGHMLGGVSGISPSEVVILGAGSVSEFAARAASGLGAQVKVFDNNIYKLRRLQSSLGFRISTSIIQPKVLAKALKTADVVIGAIHSPEGRTPCVITEEMVSQMKPGSIIVDVCIDQGGCCETSHITNHTEPVFKKYGVIHYCVPNIASRVSRTASYAFSNIITPIILRISEEGGIEDLLRQDTGVRNGAYLFNGILTNKHIGEYFNLPHKDIDLLMAASF